MNCQEVNDLMHRYVDHDLQDGEEQGMRRHIESCPACSIMFERLVQLSSELEHLPKVTPPFSIVDSILPQLEALQIEPAAGNPVTAAPVIKPSYQAQSRSNVSTGWFDRFRKHVSYKVMAGTAAAIIFGVISVNMLEQAKTTEFDAQNSNSAADMAASNNSAKEEAGILSDPEAGLQLEAAEAPTESADGGQGNQVSTDQDAQVTDQFTESVDHGNTTDESADSSNGGEPKSFASSDDSGQARKQPAAKKSDRSEEFTVRDQKGDNSKSKTDAPAGGTGGTTDNIVSGGGEAVAEPVPAPELGPTDQGKMHGIMGMPGPEPEQQVSPDGKYAAYVENNVVIIVEAETAVRLFESNAYPDSQVVIEWSTDSRMLKYSITFGEGQSETYTVDMSSIISK